VFVCLSVFVFETQDNSLKSSVELRLQRWAQALVSRVFPQEPMDWTGLQVPLKRSSSQGPDYPIVYQSAFFPWLTKVFPLPDGLDGWQNHTIVALPRWQEECGRRFEVALLPHYGLRIGVGGPRIVENLHRWLQAPPALYFPALKQPLFAKTGEGCEIAYHHDRCCQILALAQRQGWLPYPPPWTALTWETGFQTSWATDSTKRSLLEAWIDQTDAFVSAPHRLITGIPHFLKCLAQYDRAHPWGALAQTLPPQVFWGHCALLAASDRLLDQVLKGLRT
jgi:hypothetical protein